MARILLVDDEKVARALYGDFLAAEGHEVVAVGSLAEARTALSRQGFEIVVTDLLLPDEDGMEVLRYTKESFPDVEVIVITALDKVSPAVRAIKSGAAEYLVKPVAPEMLHHAISRTLTARKLFRENASLREYVTLLETGQRISTTLDRRHLAQTAGHAFSQATGAPAVMLFQRLSKNEFALQGSYGLTPEAEKELLERVRVQLRDASGEAPQRIEGTTKYPAIWDFPAWDGDLAWGHAVLLLPSELPASVSSSASYLAKHLALAWRTLGRFAEVEDMAYLDDLTGLYNMRYFDLVLDRELKGAQQAGGAFSLLFLDLDYFKDVNDTHGHLTGSRLLKEAGRVIKSCVRDNDVAARYGGDEYVVMLRGTESGGALKVAERIRRAFDTHRFLTQDGLSTHLTTCIGVASFPEHARDKATLLDFADRAMYRGKKSTRNVVYLASSELEATPAARHSSATG